MTITPDKPNPPKLSRKSSAVQDHSLPTSPPPLSDVSHQRQSWVSPTVEAVIAHLVIPLAFITLVLTIMPIGQPFEFDADEGINLIKALLYGKGFSLYTEIWNDQPPLLTVVLQAWFQVFGQSLLAGRSLILLFSTLLVWSLYQSIRIVIGTIPAIIGVVLLVSSYKYIQLSASVMIGLPSLSLAMLSIYTLVLYKQQFRRYLIPLSGILLALSLQTKIFTIFLVPVVALYLLDIKALFRNPATELRSQLNPILLWLFSVAVVYFMVGISFNAFNYHQLVQAHLRAATKEEFEELSGLDTLWQLVKHDITMLPLALFGGGVILYQTRWSGLLPIGWLGLATLSLLNHRPIWYHHYVLLAIPLAWLAAYGAAPMVAWVGDRHRFRQFRTRRAIALVMAVLSLLLLGRAIKEVDNKVVAFAQRFNTWLPRYYDPAVVEQLTRLRPTIHWLFTDRPSYAFQVDLAVPPEVAVFSAKRLVTGNLSTEKLLEVLQTYQPECILLSRFREILHQDQAVLSYLQQHYFMLYSTSEVEMYLRQSNVNSL